MSAADVTVETEAIVMVEGAECGTTAMRLEYRSADPYAVRAIFSSDGMEIEWTFARDLLWYGLDGIAGCGDVTVQACVSAAKTFVDLRSPEGHCRLEVPEGGIRRFLRRSADLVPFGAEPDHLDIDGMLAKLVA